MSITSGQSSLTRGKALLICGLAGTLFYVLPFGKSDDSSQAIEDETAVQSSETNGEAAIGDKAVEILNKRLQSLPQFTMRDAVRFNPFATQSQGLLNESTFAESVSASENNPEENTKVTESADVIQTPTASPTKLDITAVYNSPRGYSAVINGEIYYVGDRLPNGHMIAAISPQAIRLAFPQP